MKTESCGYSMRFTGSSTLAYVANAVDASATRRMNAPNVRIAKTFTLPIFKKLSAGCVVE